MTKLKSVTKMEKRYIFSLSGMDLFCKITPMYTHIWWKSSKNNLNRYQCYHGKHWSETMHRMRICQTLHNQSLYCNYHKMMSFPSHHGSIILSFLYFISSMFSKLNFFYQFSWDFRIQTVMGTRPWMGM